MASDYPTAIDNYGSEQAVAIQTELGVNAGRKYLEKAANYTVTAANNNAVIVTTAADVVITLPSVATVGTPFEVTVITGVASASTGTSISPNAVDQIIGNGFTPADNKDAVNTGATDVVGDAMTLVSNGSTGWYIKNVIGTWAREA